MNTNSEKQKVILKLIITILIILVIIVIALLGLLSKNKEGNNNEISLNTTIQPSKDDTTQKSQSVDKQEYFNILACIKQYLETINIKSEAYYTYDENGNRVLAIDEINIKEGIYNLLSKNYIEQNKVTIQNVYEKVETMQTSTLFVPLKISKIQNDTIKSFIVYGLVESTQNYQAINKIYMIVNIDSANNTYSIEPINQKYNNIQEIKVDKLETKIDKKNNNTFVTSNISNEDSAKDYINLYKRLVLGDIEEAYKLLEENYKTAKFGSIDNFKKYIEKNKEEIIGTRVEKYQVTQENGYTQYVCIDQNGHYYIIREKEMLDYNLILDTYTTDLPEFMKKYEQASGTEKVLLNLQKVFAAINDKDYKYVYNKLDETFKNNNFKTQEEFEEYIKQNLFENNKVTAENVEKQGETYLYKLTIKDETEENSKVVNKTFVMQLKEGTDFVMSFSIN